MAEGTGVPTSITVEFTKPKKSTKGVDFLSVKDTNGAWYNVWKADVAAAIQVGNSYNVYVETNGDFKNVLGFVPDSFTDSGDSLDDLVPGGTATEAAAPAPEAAKPAPAQKVSEDIRHFRASAIQAAALILSSREVSVDENTTLTLKDIHVLADKILAYIQKGSE